MTPEQREAKRQRDAKYRAANREKLAEKEAARYFAMHEENKARRRTAYHGQSLEQREAKRARDRAWRKANRDRVQASNAAWVAANPERAESHARVSTRNYRARKLAADHSPYTEDDVTRRYGETCYLCGELVGLRRHLDHITALARGGSDTLDNVRWTHPVCNMRKSDLEWFGPIWFGYLVDTTPEHV